MKSNLTVYKKPLFKGPLSIMKITAVLLLLSPGIVRAEGIGKGKNSGTEKTKKYAHKNFDVVIKGKITGEGGIGLAGVSVVDKATSKGTTSDNDGNFSISVADANATLIFSNVAYETQEIALAGRSEINVALLSATKTIDQVVVIGYGTANKRDLTGSIVRVAGRDVADKPNTNPISSLQGKVSGVSIVNTGRPGQEPDIRIRGTVSRYQTKPLYVVDGLLNDNINYLNPAEIESMEILKDPSSLAIFGVRGANGVIIVTTKQAKTGQVTVNFNSNVGFKKIVDNIDLTDAAGFKTLFDEQRVAQGTAPFAFYDRFTGNSDWIKLISADKPLVTSNNISISSGSEKNKFHLGVGYIREEGLIKYQTLDKIMVNMSDELKVSKNFKVGFNMNGYKAKLPQGGDFISAVIATPIVEPYNADGLLNKLPNEIGGPQIGNPLFIDKTRGTDLSNEYRAIGSVFAELNLLRDLTFRATYYADLGFNDQRKYTPLVKVYGAEDDTATAYSGFTQTEVFQKENKFSKFQQEYLLTYKKSFGEHSLTALGGFTTYYSSYTETNGRVRQPATGNPIPNDKRFWYIDNFFGDPSTKVSGIQTENDLFQNPKPLQWESTTVSTLFRLLYNYKGKYMLNGSFRRDGSSEISSKNRFQNFIAVGAGWEITKEDFMNSQNVFNFLKLKASYGVLGNQYVGIHYPFLPQLVSGGSAVFGNNLVPAYKPAYLADENLKWETVTSAEVGIEMLTLKNRLRFEVNYFNKLTDNLLTTFPEINGAQAGITNAGKIQNNGLEASASWSDKLGNGLGYSISGNITTLHNKVKEIYVDGFEIFDGPSTVTAGRPIGYFYGYEVDGIYQSFADKLGAPAAGSLGEYGPGDLKFKDQNGDNIIDADDRVEIGNPTPDFIYGFSLGLDYKGFDFGVDFQGVYGNEIYRDWGNGGSFAPFNYRADRLNRWTGPGTSNFEFGTSGNSINRIASTYMIEDGSYLRLRNLQFGYNFGRTSLSRLKIKSLRLFVNGQNLKTFKHNSGFTPEFAGSATKFGVDDGSYPVPAIYSAGFNVTF